MRQAPLAHDNQNTAQHFAIASASARKPRRETDTQDQTHAEDRHGELIIAGGEKKKREGGRELEGMREVIQLKCDAAARTCG